ncbi:unnamed protein product [Vicia faba]|uniref:Dynamin GTPase domain-containing protein n=1 Tax=Vicia faba TaxID=3906 RepID=A0AAV0Z4J3_VICFA|nr:unnamed protein product [Vicia faba]
MHKNFIVEPIVILLHVENHVSPSNFLFAFLNCVVIIDCKSKKNSVENNHFYVHGNISSSLIHRVPSIKFYVLADPTSLLTYIRDHLELLNEFSSVPYPGQVALLRFPQVYDIRVVDILKNACLNFADDEHLLIILQEAYATNMQYLFYNLWYIEINIDLALHLLANCLYESYGCELLSKFEHQVTQDGWKSNNMNGHDARKTTNVGSWDTLIAAYLQNGQALEAFQLFLQMIRRNIREPERVLEYNGKNVSTDEANVSDVINTATEELAGTAKGVSNNPLALTVKKNSVPDLTMMDLMGITRVLVHGQLDNIYDKIKDIIMEYITPEESIMLNVLSDTIDFTICESIRMSQSVDKTGFENFGLGYICVRNRIGDESYEEARNEEHKLFESHSLLSKIDKSIVGFLVLAQKLVHVQAMIISKTLSEITKKINEKLNNNLKELENFPANLSSLTDAMSVFMRIVALSRDSLRNILLIGDF